MSTPKKIEKVEKITEKLTRAKTVILTNYQGLTHHQIEELKRGIKKVGGDFVVVKNTLFKLALKKINRPRLASLTGDLSGPTALLLSYEDEIQPLKEVNRCLQQFQLPILKAGIVGDQVLTGEELIAIAALPSKEVLLARFTFQLASPLYRLQNALSLNLQKLVLTLKMIENSRIKSFQS